MKTLLTFLALTASLFGASATVWRDGAGVPSNALGANGDYYLERSTGDVYQKVNNVYTKKLTLKGPAGPVGPQGPQGIQGPPGPAGGTTPTPTPDPVASSPLLPTGSIGFATVETVGGLRDDFAGWVGMQIVIGAEAVTVTHLGRMMVAGNAGTHPVKLVSVSTKQDVAGGSTAVNMAGGTAGKFQYTKLAAPLTLTANSSYWLLTKVSLGGDKWHNDVGTKLTTHPAATINAHVWATSDDIAGSVQVVPSDRQGYGPLNLGFVGSPVSIPPPTQPVGSSNIPPGTKGTLTLLGYSGDFPPTALQWSKDGTAIPGATAAAYVITSATAADAGRYDLKVTNGRGQGGGSVDITVQ